MSEDFKNLLAILSPFCALAGWFVLGIVFEPLAIIFGVIGAFSKCVGFKAAGIIGAIAGAICLTVLLYYFSILSAIKF